MKDTNVDTILSAAGIAVPPGTDPNEIVKKILADHLVGERVFALLIEEYAAQALQNFHALEIATLHKRLGIVEPDKPLVEWGLGTTVSGKPMIVGKCGAETIYCDGPAEGLARVRFRGEVVSADVAAAYRMTLGDGGDSEYQKAQRDYASKEFAKIKQAEREVKEKYVKQW